MKKLLLILAILSIPAHAVQFDFDLNSGRIANTRKSESIQAINSNLFHFPGWMPRNDTEKELRVRDLKDQALKADHETLAAIAKRSFVSCCFSAAILADQFIANTYMLNAKSHETMAQYYLQ